MKKKVSKSKSKPFVIVRAHTAGVHAGTLESLDAKTGTAVLSNSRRLWFWNGGSLSEVAVYGLAAGDNKIGALMPSVTIVSPQGFELGECTEAGKASILGAKEWRK